MITQVDDHGSYAPSGWIVLRVEHDWSMLLLDNTYRRWLDEHCGRNYAFLHRHTVKDLDDVFRVAFRFETDAVAFALRFRDES